MLEGGGVGAEGIEVGDDQVDGLDAVGGHLRLVIGVVSIGEDPSMHLGVQGDHAVAQDGREAGELGQVCDGQVRPRATLRPCRRWREGPSPEPRSSRRELDDAGLVVDGEEGSHEDERLPIEQGGIGQHSTDRGRIETPLDRLDPLVQRGLVVSRQDRHRLLGDDGPCIDLERGQVHRAASDLHSRLQGRPHRVPAGEGW